MTQPRDFTAVLAAVLAEVPDEAPLLRTVLETVQRQAARHAPEIRWQRDGAHVQDILSAETALLSEEERAGWRGRMIAAWTGATEPATEKVKE